MYTNFCYLPNDRTHNGRSFGQTCSGVDITEDSGTDSTDFSKIVIFVYNNIGGAVCGRAVICTSGYFDIVLYSLSLGDCDVFADDVVVVLSVT